MKGARDSYNRWCCASSLERAHERGEPSEFLKKEKFVRVQNIGDAVKSSFSSRL